MSRSGYSEDCDNDWYQIMYRGQVASAVRGRRGQKLFRDLVAGMEAMPVKRLISDELKTRDGEFCALGVVGNLRGIVMDDIDPEDVSRVAKTFDIAEPLARSRIRSRISL